MRATRAGGPHPTSSEDRSVSVELAKDSPFRAREFIAGKDAVTLATNIHALDQEQFSAGFLMSPMKPANSVSCSGMRC